jgi:hypothetical protein
LEPLEDENLLVLQNCGIKVTGLGKAKVKKLSDEVNQYLKDGKIPQHYINAC